MASKYSHDNESIADINVVPLVDIILVVLIIFMVTAPMIMKPSIKVNLPQAASGEQTVQTQLNVTIAANGTLSLNGKAADATTISNEAKSALAQNPDIQAVISADKDVPHGAVVQVLDLIKTVGIKKFAISIDKK
ncbi:MAG: ExbD/TolR family protein [Bdellovibrionales bacterium]